MKNKKLMFVFAMLSLAGVFMGWEAYNGYRIERFLETWFLWSLPLVV